MLQGRHAFYSKKEAWETYWKRYVRHSKEKVPQIDMDRRLGDVRIIHEKAGRV